MHIPVLKEKVIEVLDPRPNKNFVDCTFGEGGHTKEILKRNGPKGKVLALEIDPVLYEKGKRLEEEFKGRLILKNRNFSEIKEVVKKEGFENISGVLFDLGISLWHLEESGRGFTFKRNEPLIMRYDNNLNSLLARDVLNQFSEKEIERILREYGQEKFSKKIAREIIRERKKRKIETTFDLVELIKKAIPPWARKGRIHFATKTFMALRIFINQELENLEKGLEGALEILKPKGKIVVISFHSLEEKIVKNFFKKAKKEGRLEIITKKPISPSKEEIFLNKKARSAKMRVAEKL